MYAWRNIETRSLNECCHGKTVSVKYSNSITTYLFTAIWLSPGDSGYFTCIQNMKLIATRFKSGGLHEKQKCVWRIKDQLDVTCYFISLIFSGINISIIRSLRLCCWITTLVVLFSFRCVLEIWCGWVWVVSVLQASACYMDTTPIQPHRKSNTHRTKNNTTNVVIQQHSRKLLMMDVLMSETCWAHKKWNKIASDIKLVFYSSAITMMHGPINVRFWVCVCSHSYAVCRAHAPYCYLRPVRLYNIFPNYLLNSTV